MKKVLLFIMTVLIIPTMVNAKVYDGVKINDGTYFYNGDIIKNIKGLPLDEIELTYTNKENTTLNYDNRFLFHEYKYPISQVKYFVINKNNTTNLEYVELYPSYEEYYSNFEAYKPYMVYDEENDKFTEYGYKFTIGKLNSYEDNEVPDTRWILKKYNEKNTKNSGCAIFTMNSTINDDTGNLEYYINNGYSGCYYGYADTNTLELNVYEAEPSKPEVKITCDKITLKKDESTSCELQITYKYEADELSFSLETVKSKISDIQLNENWTLNNGVYSIKGDTPEKKEYLSNISKGLKVATFNAKYENTLGATDPEEEIQISIISKEVTLKNEIENIVAEDKQVDLTVSDKEIPEEENTPGNEDDTPTDEEPIENPETGVYDVLSLVFLIVMLTTVLYTKAKENNLFKQI